MDRDAAPLREAIAPLDERTRDIPLESFRFWKRQTHEIRCNWKNYVENYLEGYHVPNVHPTLNGRIDAAQYKVDIYPPVIIHWAPPGAMRRCPACGPGCGRATA